MDLIIRLIIWAVKTMVSELTKDQSTASSPPRSAPQPAAGPPPLRPAPRSPAEPPPLLSAPHERGSYTVRLLALHDRINQLSRASRAHREALRQVASELRDLTVGIPNFREILERLEASVEDVARARPEGSDRDAPTDRVASVVAALQQSLARHRSDGLRQPAAGRPGPPPFQPEETPWRWGETVEWTWHDFLASVPNLRQELTELVAKPLAGTDAHQGAEFVGDLAAAWVDDLFADAATALTLGPGHLHALVRRAQAAPPDRALTIGVTRDGMVEPPTPYHARIVFTARLLEFVGIGEEADTALAAWRHSLPPAPGFALRNVYSFDWIPFAMIEPHLGAVAARVAGTPLDALSGASLDALPLTEDTHALPAHALALEARWLEGQPVGGAPLRHVLAALTRSARRSPLTPPAIEAAHATLDASLAGPPRRTSRRRRAERPASSRRSVHRAIRQAVIMGELLTPPDARAG